MQAPRRTNAASLHVRKADTPGFMVGPEAEKTALVRHVCRMFVTTANLDIPYFTIVLRKSYGLGAQAMAGGGIHAQCLTISWPTGEFGGMGLKAPFASAFAGARRDRGPARARKAVPVDGGEILRGRQGDQHRLGARDRSGDRPGRNAALDRPRPRFVPGGPAKRGPKAPVRRYVVSPSTTAHFRLNSVAAPTGERSTASPLSPGA